MCGHIVDIRSMSENIELRSIKPFEFPFAYEHCLTGVKARYVLLSCRSGNDIGSNLRQFVKLNVQRFR